MTSLSKSKYCRGFQCPKMLWMDFYMPEKAVKKASESVLANGSAVGDVAMGYFGDFSEVPFSLNKQEMCDTTEKLLAENTSVIAEASFLYDNCFCSVDLLRKAEDGYELIEVKSSTSVHAIYLEDMAYQYYVLTQCKIPVVRVFNMYINNKYERHGELDLKQLFVLQDCTEECLLRQSDVKEKIAALKDLLNKTDEPQKDIGMYCDDPYECDYKEYCRGVCGVQEPSVFSVASLSGKKKYKLYNDGIITFDDIMKKQPKELNENNMLQVKMEQNNSPARIEKEKIKEFLGTIRYPLYHLDFETFQQAVPEYDGVIPYNMIPFQYSLHVQRSACAKPEHYEFLAIEGLDPRRALAEQLCKDIPADVCVLAYHSSTEIGIMKKLAVQFPDLSAHLLSICKNTLDLMVPFQKKYYYCKEMQGSYSIKYVLPALCPNDPELDYHALDGIHNGGEAMNAFAELPKHTPEEIDLIRKQLLAYCKLDTLAMVKVLEKLYEAVK